MPIYNIDSDIWVRPSAYAQERKVNRQKVNYWIKNNLVEIREYKGLDLLLIRRGSEKGAAAATIPTKPEIIQQKLPPEIPHRSNGIPKIKMKRRSSVS